MGNMFEIYFSDLNEKAQKEVLEFVGVSDPKEMNWDIDINPIAIYEIEDPACEDCQEFDCTLCEHLKRRTDVKSN